MRGHRHRGAWLALLAITTLSIMLLPTGPQNGGTGPVVHAAHDHGTFADTTFAEALACWPSGLPLGALPPAAPIWCTSPEDGPSTYVEGENSWVDEFDHGLSNASMGVGYQVFESKNRVNKTQHFRHLDHWMVDVNGTGRGAPNNFGGAVMRPDRSFRFQDGRLVVEADVAAGVYDYKLNAWPELVITTASAPTARENWGLYAYNNFPRHFTFGCILNSTQWIGCALLDDSGRPPESDEIWQASNFQRQGSTVFGGEPGTPDPTRRGRDIGDAWRVCRGNDPDINCRDRFRWEITKTGFTMHVNGTRYYEQSGLFPGKQIPDALVNGDVYVYFGSYIGVPQADVVRFHWDRIAINP